MADDDSEEGPVLDPEELDVADDERVARLDENRYVVAADDGPPSVDTAVDSADNDGDADEDGGTRAVDGEAVADWLAASFRDNGFQYGFDATVKVDGAVDRHRMVSNDVVATFETLLLWYGRQAGTDADVPEALGLLLAESGVPVQLPPQAVRNALERHDVDADDSVADLLSAIEDDGGFQIGSR